MQQSQAELSIAQANHKRNQELVAQNFISQRSVDESAANLEVAQAKLALARATAARLRIVAPFDGIAGIRNISVGDYLKDGADIVNIEDMDAIYVDFRLPERLQTKLHKGQNAWVDIDALPGRKFSALIQAIDPLVDANGRSIGVRGCIDNRNLQLRPGMFARVTAVFGERDNARTIPEEAIAAAGRPPVRHPAGGRPRPGHPDRAAGGGQGGHPPARPRRDHRRPAARRHGRHRRPAAGAKGRHAGARAGARRQDRRRPVRRAEWRAVGERAAGFGRRRAHARDCAGGGGRIDGSKTGRAQSLQRRRGRSGTAGALRSGSTRPAR